MPLSSLKTPFCSVHTRIWKSEDYDSKLLSFNKVYVTCKIVTHLNVWAAVYTQILSKMHLYGKLYIIQQFWKFPKTCIMWAFFLENNKLHDTIIVSSEN